VSIDRRLASFQAAIGHRPNTVWIRRHPKAHIQFVPISPSPLKLNALLEDWVEYDDQYVPGHRSPRGSDPRVKYRKNMSIVSRSFITPLPQLGRRGRTVCVCASPQKKGERIKDGFRFDGTMMRWVSYNGSGLSFPAMA